jgi:lipoyl(octanoyl) transferase
MSFPFRLIDDGLRPGPHNMARDEAISRAVGAGAQKPTLRLYGWQPAAISIGLAQRVGTVDEVMTRADGIAIVRRSTGGLAILHVDELTYSLSMPLSHPLAEGDILTSYQRIAQAIIRALNLLGVSDARADKVAKEDQARGPVCFEAPSHYEVMGGGKKLVGSAQWRRSDGLLQHGSLPLCGDIARICRYLPDAPLPDQVRARAGTLAEIAQREVSWQEAAQAWQQAFTQTLDITFERAVLSAEEERHATELLSTRYGNDAWNKRR